MDESIIISNLTKVYTEGHIKVKAVSSVDLHLYGGEIVGLFGPSGSGKTTLLSLIGCILSPTAGSVKIYGTEITALREADLSKMRRKYISFIFQGFNLFPALTAYENIMLVLGLRGWGGIDTKGKASSAPAADKRAKDLLTQMGLSERMHFLPRDLSGGQKQRVSIARALATDSPIILADEPTANLDQANGRKVMEILRRFAAEQKKCVVVATHDNRLEDIFDRILIMEDGKIMSEKR
jgi:putative ABC transport system ATP-binding protein